MDWKKSFNKEMQMAAAARERGNEGQARVCARRAAGVVVRAYFQLRGLPAHNSSAYDLLRDLLAGSGVPEQARQAAVYLTLRVNEAFELPVEVDLLDAAQTLAASLLPDRDDSPPADKL